MIGRAQLLGVAAILTVVGCRHAGPFPEAAVRQYLDAIEHRQFERAMTLLSDAYRDGHSAQDLERAMSSRDAATAKKALAHARVDRYCELELASGERIRLIEERGQWRLADNPLEWYPQTTPAEALSSFVRALERERYDVALRFIPSAYRASLTADALRARWQGDQRQALNAQLAEVRAHLHEPFDLEGDTRALLPLGENRAVRLVREAGVWKVEALQ